MLTRNETVNLKRKIVHAYNKINELKEKEKTYDEDVCEKEDLQRRVNDLQRVLEDVARDMKQTNENHLKKKDSISKMLEHCKTKENLLSVNNQRLRDAIDHKTRRLDTLRLNKENLTNSVEKLNKCNEVLKNELDNVEASVEEREEANGRLSRMLASKEDECCDLRKQTAECRTTVGRLREKIIVLEVSLECGLAAVKDAKARLAETTGRLELERGALTGRLEAENRVLRDTKAECADVERRAADEERRAAELAECVTELRDVGAALRRDADAKKQWLAEDVAAKEAHVCRLDEQLAALRRDGETAADHVATYGRLVRDKADQLAKAQARADDESRKRADALEQWSREVEALRRDARNRAAELDELEREASRLRDENEDRLVKCEDDNDDYCDGGGDSDMVEGHSDKHDLSRE